MVLTRSQSYLDKADWMRAFATTILSLFPPSLENPPPIFPPPLFLQSLNQILNLSLQIPSFNFFLSPHTPFLSL
ncbi:hypothetical protein L2E82_10382 [Cichorium intybus]|uniref:Uncharacterized protein n=1 Tax=Cichorium intybus TaxID=13427 RepID=A0ACB9GBL3_CICIN|nr:hypothetical protein L2E82_10382 [Cichorium intybus]